MKRTLRRLATDLLTSSVARYLALVLELVSFALAHYGRRLTARGKSSRA